MITDCISSSLAAACYMVFDAGDLVFVGFCIVRAVSHTHLVRVGVSAVARRHGLDPSQICAWRHLKVCAPDNDLADIMRTSAN